MSDDRKTLDVTVSVQYFAEHYKDRYTLIMFTGVRTYLFPRKSEWVFVFVCVSVCVSVCDHDN